VVLFLISACAGGGDASRRLIGDRYGRKRLLLASLTLFGLGSAACAVSTSSAEFIAARVLLGAAGAGVIVMALSALTVLFSEEERPKAVGVWSAASFIAFPIGPIVGGWLLSHAWWGWVFLMNIPVAALGLLAAKLLIPESRSERRPALDRLGMVSSVAGLLAVTYGLIEAGQHGWGSGPALGAIIAGIALLAGFLAWQRHLGAQPRGEPLVDPQLFRSRSYTWGVILIAVLVLSMMGVLFTMPQYFQGVVGTDAMGSGVRLLALVGGLVCGPLPAERIAHALGAKITAAAGFALLGAGLALGSTTAVGSSAGFVATWMALVGAGMGVALATASSAALSELDEEHGAIGSAVLQAVNKTGGPLGTAVLGSVLSSGYLARLQLAGLPARAAQTARASIFYAVAVAQRLHAPALLHSARAAFVHGMGQSLLVSAGIGAAGVILALMFLPRDATAKAAARPTTAQGEIAVSQ
jgi:MFS transporter, DHA2 family, multidrug resistance protein